MAYAKDEDLSSEFEFGGSKKQTWNQRYGLDEKPSTSRKDYGDRSQRLQDFDRLKGIDDRRYLLGLDAYARHKRLVNEYILCFPGATRLLQRDTSMDKTDIDIIRENNKFLWDSDAQATSWEKKLAKKYWDKLFKEYCIADLSRFKENKIAMRWRTEKEVISAKGQFICGNRNCHDKSSLTSWEVNFGYVEDGSKKNALVKLRLCPDCSKKLNYHHKRKQAIRKRLVKYARKLKRSFEDDVSILSGSESTTKEGTESSSQTAGDKGSASGCQSEVTEPQTVAPTDTTYNENPAVANKILTDADESAIWSKPIEVEQEKSRDEEFESFLEDLLL